MNTSQFTLTDLVHHLIRYAWLTIILTILGAGSMYVYTKRVALPPARFSASREVYVGTANKKNPYSSFQANESLLSSYIIVANDNKIISATKKDLAQRGWKISKNDISKSISIDSVNGTLFIRFSASATSESKAAELVNAYTESFADQGTKLLPSMPKPVLMSKASKAKVKPSVAGPVHKKAILFGASFGLTLGIVLSLIIGVYKNYKKIERSE
ncbi:capsular biosynthesis protein [Oenococcus sicerae]|uniref:Capsular biosynthesis protein n=1 Tax=Oenococcus sicerae TaxID=2203724 RepID=A0AAJ1VN94_9LACO|nr:capsular biosynthesis protein [Oenococcus sicerae]MDN6899959.1 capsular biosynthesis protein [Oenococcus sicerae]QAS69576.1 capsular biosynthesis protein [Oenococcus sicerae]